MGGKMNEEDLTIKNPKLEDAANELVDLLSQNKRVFLFGAGSSKCAGLPLMNELTNSVLEKLEDSSDHYQILEEIKNNFEGSETCNIEDYMSELVDLISICERRKVKNSDVNEIKIGEDECTLKELNVLLKDIKDSIQELLQEKETSLDTHRKFIRNIHGRLVSGKSPIKQKVDYFTLNYDTLVEDALSLEQISFADGFDGGVTGWWDIKTYERDLIDARVFKIHGSIDWCLLENDVLPRRIRSDMGISRKSEPVLIWPASTKYRETQRDPYAQILNKLRKTLRPSSNTEVVLTILGYSFNDSHINYELDRALNESGGSLTIVVLTNKNELDGLLKTWHEDPILSEQVIIYSKGGYYHDNDAIRSGEDISWWKFRPFVQLIGGRL